MGKLSELEIAVIGAQSLRWPPPDTSLQWQALHEVVGTAKHIARQADDDIAAAESNSNLSLEGKRRKVTELAATAIAALDRSDHFERPSKLWADGWNALMGRLACNRNP